MGQARRFAADVLEAWGIPGLVDTTTLLVSELVTNAILHARSDCDLGLQVTQGRLRVEVHDRSPVEPTRRDYDADAGTGRGMLLVEALASAWGADTAEDGKRVWFEVVDDTIDLDALVDAPGAETRPATRRASTRPGGPAGHGPAPVRRRQTQLFAPPATRAGRR